MLHKDMLLHCPNANKIATNLFSLLCLQQREYALVKFFLQAQNIRHLYFQSDRNTKGKITYTLIIEVLGCP